MLSFSFKNGKESPAIHSHHNSVYKKLFYFLLIVLAAHSVVLLNNHGWEAKSIHNDIGSILVVWGTIYLSFEQLLFWPALLLFFKSHNLSDLSKGSIKQMNQIENYDQKKIA